jgi:ribosomal protein S2
LVDNNILHLSSKTAEDLSNEIVLLADEIEHYRTMITSEQCLDLDQNLFHRTFDNQYHQQFLANTQSNYSVLSFLQQSTSMDMSLLVTADFSSQMQSTLFTSTVQQQQQSSSNGGKVADVGKFEACDSMD